MPPLAAAAKVAAIAATAAKVATIAASKGAAVAGKSILTGSAAAAPTTTAGKIGAGLVNVGAGMQGHGPMAGLSMLAGGGGSSSPASPVATSSSSATPYNPQPPAPLPGMVNGDDGQQRMKRFGDYFQEAMKQQ